jgi:hypothetical protein
MGIFDSLISGESETKAKDTTPVPYKELRPGIADFFEQWLASGGLAFDPTGAISITQTPSSGLVAPLDANQLALIQQMFGSATTPPAYLTGAENELTKTLGGGYLSPEANPFLAAMIQTAQRPVTNAFNDVVVPNLLSRFTGGGQEVQGQGSSAFASQARQAGQGYLDTLADIGVKIAGPAYGAERERQFQGIAQAGQLSTDQLNRMSETLKAVSLPQLVQDLGIERGMTEFNRRFDALLEVLRLAGAASVGQAGAKSKTDVTPPLFSF